MNIRFQRFAFLVVLVMVNMAVLAQNGGNSIYEFLNMPGAARVAAIGDNHLASNDNDLTLTLTNPSLINKEMHNNLALSFIDYYSDINYGFAMYSRTFDKLGSYTGTVQFINYGTFTYADETGQTYGTFSAGEYAFNLGWGRALDSSFCIGANLKAVYSSLESYHSFGMAVDVAGSYINQMKDLTLSLVVRNMGAQITTYYSGNREPLPFEIQLGLSKKLKYLPFRYIINLNNLENWSLAYTDPNDPGNYDPFTGQQKTKSGIEKFGDELMRHIVVGGELTPIKNISLRLGYNYKRRQELKVNDKPGTVGFSWGIGIKISKFQINYARSTYHLTGSPNYFSIIVNFQEFMKKN